MHGPGNGAATRWSGGLLGREYPIPFTVAAHAGHAYTTDRDGTVSAYDTLNKATILWSTRLINATDSELGTVDIVPIVVSEGELERQIVVASCLQLLPHNCRLASLDQDGTILWKIDTFTGRIYQPVPVNDGEIIVVPVCPRLSPNMKNDCRLYAVNLNTGMLVWYRVLDTGFIRGDVLLSRSGVLLVPMCDFVTFKASRQCLRVFVGIQAENGVSLWTRNWNSTDSFINHHNHTSNPASHDDDEATKSASSTPSSTSLVPADTKSLPKMGPFGLQMNSQFTGLIADGVFITLADDNEDHVWAVGTNMASGRNNFLVKLPGTLGSRHFVGCAATPMSGKPRQLFFMTSNMIISLDSTGSVIWKNSNVSNLVRTMAVDSGGAIYVATTERRSNSQYISTLDVYDAEGGSYSYSLPIPSCSSDSPTNMTIIPSFVISSERLALIMCQGRIYAIYSSIVPIWAWIVLSAAFGLILLTIFLVGFLYHRRTRSRFEDLS